MEHGQRMAAGCWQRRILAIALGLAAIPLAASLGGGCALHALAHDPAYAGPRPLDAALAAPFAYEPAAVEPALAPLGDRAECVWLGGRFPAPCPATGDPTEVEFELFVSKRAASAGGRAPLVVIVPILGGGYGIERMLADACAGEGWHALIVHREKNLLDGDNDPEDVERLLRRALVSIRRTLDWALDRDDMDPARVGLVGISLGAIMGSVLAAVEPRLGPTVLVMGGGDIPTIVRDSVEQPVHLYKVARMDRLGLADDAALVESLRPFRLDPLAYAPSVDARDVLQLVTLYDNRVPTRNQWLLWEALGKPRGFAIPSGHYSLAVYREEAVGAMRAFFAERFGAGTGLGVTVTAAPIAGGVGEVREGP